MGQNSNPQGRHLRGAWTQIQSYTPKRPTHTRNQNHENFLTRGPTSTQPEPSPSLSRAAKNNFATHSTRPHTTPHKVTVY